jgi:hypothetical protein
VKTVAILSVLIVMALPGSAGAHARYHHPHAHRSLRHAVHHQGHRASNTEERAEEWATPEEERRGLEEWLAYTSNLSATERAEVEATDAGEPADY